jgi:hypothetical protein
MDAMDVMDVMNVDLVLKVLSVIASTLVVLLFVDTCKNATILCKDVLRLFSPWLSVQQFYELLAEVHVIERLDIDRVDCDNFFLALALLLRRRGKVSQFKTRVNRFTYKWFGATFFNVEPLHIVLVGRPMSPLTSPAFFDEESKTFSLERLVKDGDDVRATLWSVPKPVIREEPWEREFHDAEASELLLRYSAAQLRAFLFDAGVLPFEFVLYNGGVPPSAGLSCHTHSQDWFFNERADCWSSEFTPAAVLKRKERLWRDLSFDARKRLFEATVTAPSESMLSLRPLQAFERYCLTNSAPIALYVGSPLTALAASFHVTPLNLRVCYVAAMSGAWDGSLNLLGACFNNAVDWPSTQAFFAPLFPKARIVLVPTETCKKGPFSVVPDDLPAGIVASLVEQWYTLKRSVPQTLFDGVVVLPWRCFLGVGLVPAAVEFPEPTKMTLTALEETPLSHNSFFPPGLYATLHDFDLVPVDFLRAEFLSMVRRVCALA